MAKAKLSDECGKLITLMHSYRACRKFGEGGKIGLRSDLVILSTNDNTVLVDTMSGLKYPCLSLFKEIFNELNFVAKSMSAVAAYDRLLVNTKTWFVADNSTPNSKFHVFSLNCCHYMC